MTSWRCVAKIVLFSAIAAAATNASARDLGRTSRASILISVSVPARLEVKRRMHVDMGDLRSRRSVSQPLCVLTSAPGSTYSVTWLSADGESNVSLPQDAAASPLVVEWADQGSSSAEISAGGTAAGFEPDPIGSCHPTSDRSTRLTVKSVDRSRSPDVSAEQITLLIAPD